MNYFDQNGLFEGNMERKFVEVYTDGACSGNPGVGGWGVVLLYNGIKKELSGFFPETTNNRMELFSALQGLKQLKVPCDVHLYSDSTYLVDAFNKGWIVGWQKNKWRTAGKDEVKNQDLWRALLVEVARHNVTFIKVKGHSDNFYNNRCDEMAREEIKLHRS